MKTIGRAGERLLRPLLGALRCADNQCWKQERSVIFGLAAAVMVAVSDTGNVYGFAASSRE